MPTLPSAVIAFWGLTALDVALLAAFRACFLRLFRHRAPNVPAHEVRRALRLGTRFDLRLAVLLGLPPLLLSFVPGLGLDGGTGRSVWWIWVVATWTAVTVVHLADLAHFDYLSTRLNATVFEHLDAPGTALRTGWESFPVLRGAAALALVAAGYAFATDAWLDFATRAGAQPPDGVLALVAWGATVVLVLLGLHGSLVRFPLRWSDAYASTDPFAAALALNPVLFLRDTWANRGARYDREAVERHYPEVSRMLGVTRPDPLTFDLARRVEPARRDGRPPNVVVLVLESLAAYKTGAYGNTLDPSPHLDAVARRSVQFRNFFAVTSPTARAMFTLLTGIPDTNPMHSASRNPMAVRQRTLVNAFEGYRKMFFIGGSASWGNLRGVLSHNVPDLEIFERTSFDRPRADGWGISDRHLFIEADAIFRREERPFFALMLASGNHRPWTIPEDRGDFQLRDVSQETLRANGFDSLDEFNSFRFLDHSIGELFRRVDDSQYGRDTVFMLLGDHGAGAPVETVWERLGLTHVHTPFLVMAPGRLTPREVDTVVSSVDVLPTALGLCGLAYENTTFGRDAFETRPAADRLAFIRRPPHHGLVGQDLFFRLGPRDRGELFAYRTATPCDDVSSLHPAEAERMRALCIGIRETSRHLLHVEPRGRRA